MVAPTAEQELALDCDKDTAVIASAGTGKTSVLTERFVRALDSVVSLDSIVAITFTEKAAAEMKEKVRSVIAERVQMGGPSAAAFDAARDDLFTANIATIHAFCRQILMENPVEAGVDHGFNVIKGVDEAALVDRTLARLLDEAARDRELKEPLSILLSRHSTDQITTMLTTLAANRDLASTLIGPRFSSYESPEAVLEHWRGLVERERAAAVNQLLAETAFHRSLTKLMAGDPRDAAELAGSGLGLLGTLIREGATDAERVEAAADLLATLIDAGTSIGDDVTLLALLDVPAGSPSAAVRAVADGILSLRADLELAVTERDEDAAHTVHALLSLYRAYIERYDAAKRELNALDFEDLLQRTEQLFTSEPDVLARYRQRFRHILVDEFQDTDPVQWRMIRMLWNGGRNRQSLFIVGDPKQSIYAFRSADVTIFNEARRMIKGAGGVDPELSVNFRSLPGVLRFVHAVFPNVLRPELRGWEEEARRAIIGQPFEAEYGAEPKAERKGEDVAGSVELILPGEPKDGVEGLCDAERELYALVARLREVVESGEKQVVDVDGPRPARWKDVAILIQARTNLATLEAALDAHRIPYTVYRGAGFFQTQEVRDLASLIAALVDPDDDLALAAVCRSPFLTLSDEDLLRISLERRGHLRNGLKWLAADAGFPHAARAVRLLEDWSASVDREPLHRLLDRALEESGAWAVYASLHRGAQRVTNIRKLLAIARESEEMPLFNASSFLRILRSQIENETKEGAADVVEDADRDAVQVMTVHAAKGLQFPITVVPHIHRKPQYSTRGRVLLDDEVGPGIRAPDLNNEYGDTLARTLIKRRIPRKEWAEHKRLFYVATTRAADHLILSGIPDKVKVRGERGDPMDQNTWMGWLFESLDLDPSNPPDDGDTVGPMTVHVVPPELPGRPTLEGTPLTVLDPSNALLTAPAVVPDNLIPIHASIRPERLSPTAIMQYLSCPAKYRARFVLGLPEDQAIDDDRGENGVHASVRGGIVHRALEMGVTDATVLEALCRERGVSDAGQVKALVEEAQAAVRAFASSDFGKAAASADAIQREQPFEFDLHGVRLFGFIDLMFRDGDVWHVVDYKTNRNTDYDHILRKYHMQMAIYQMAASKALGVPVEKVKSSIFLTRSGEVVDATCTESGIRTTRDLVGSVIEGIEEGRFEPTGKESKDSAVCRWCEYGHLLHCVFPAE